MAYHYVVRDQFEHDDIQYNRGDMITDQKIISEIMQDHHPRLIRIAAPEVVEEK